MKSCKPLIAVLTLGLLGLCATPGLGLATSVLQIQFSGVDAIYDGYHLYDAKAIEGGAAYGPEVADPLVTMSFLLDGINQGTLLGDIYIDFRIAALTNIPVGGGTVYGTGDGFDLLTSSVGQGIGLGLTIDQTMVTYSGNEIFVNGGGVTNGIYDQALPFGLMMGTPVEYSFSLNNLYNVTDDGRFLTGFHGSGTGEVAGCAIPEPSTLVLVGLGLIGGGFFHRRRRQH